MVIFKCPNCRAEYELTRLACHSGSRTMPSAMFAIQPLYSWASRNVNLSVARLIMLEHTLRYSKRTAALVILR